MDKILITDIKLTTLIGAYAWEQTCPQNIHLDLVLQTDARKAAKSDNLEHALDYTKILEYITAFAKNNHFQLIETFVERLAQEILENFPTTSVQLTLHKPGALTQAKNVAIVIERSKS